MHTPLHAHTHTYTTHMHTHTPPALPHSAIHDPHPHTLSQDRQLPFPAQVTATHSEPCFPHPRNDPVTPTCVPSPLPGVAVGREGAAPHPQQTCPGPQLLCHLPCHPERDVTKSQGPYVSGKLTTAMGIHLLLGQAWGWGCPLRGDGSVLKLDCGEGCTTSQVSKKKKKRESKLCRVVISTERILLW